MPEGDPKVDPNAIPGDLEFIRPPHPDLIYQNRDWDPQPDSPRERRPAPKPEYIGDTPLERVTTAKNWAKAWNKMSAEGKAEVRAAQEEKYGPGISEGSYNPATGKRFPQDTSVMADAEMRQWAIGVVGSFIAGDALLPIVMSRRQNKAEARLAAQSRLTTGEVFRDPLGKSSGYDIAEYFLRPDRPGDFGGHFKSQVVHAKGKTAAEARLIQPRGEGAERKGFSELIEKEKKKAHKAAAKRAKREAAKAAVRGKASKVAARVKRAAKKPAAIAAARAINKAAADKVKAAEAKEMAKAAAKVDRAAKAKTARAKTARELKADRPTAKAPVKKAAKKTAKKTAKNVVRAFGRTGSKLVKAASSGPVAAFDLAWGMGESMSESHKRSGKKNPLQRVQAMTRKSAKAGEPRFGSFGRALKDDRLRRKEQPKRAKLKTEGPLRIKLFGTWTEW